MTETLTLTLNTVPTRAVVDAKAWMEHLIAAGTADYRCDYDQLKILHAEFWRTHKDKRMSWRVLPGMGYRVTVVDGAPRARTRKPKEQA